MLCRGCGKNIENDSIYCRFCGKAVKTKEAVYSDENISKTDLEIVKPINKKRMTVLVVAAIVTMTAIVTFIIYISVGLIFNEQSYTTVMDKALAAVRDIDVDKYMEILPPDYIQYNLDTNDEYSDYDDMCLNYEDRLWQKNRAIKKDYGTDFTMMYEIEEERHCTDENQLGKLTKEFNRKYNAKSKITESVKAVVNTEIKSPEKESSSIKQTMYFVSIDGKWYLDADEVSNIID